MPKEYELVPTEDDVAPSASNVELQPRRTVADSEVAVSDAPRSKPPSSFVSRLKEAYNLKANLSNLFFPKLAEAHMPILDGIRGFCMIWVVCTHSWIWLMWRHQGDPVYEELMFSPLLRFIRNGEYSVDAFFVLSGFLIGHVLIREHEKAGNVDLKMFFFRRFMRIAPTYYLVLAIFTPILSAIGCPNCQTCVNVGWANALFVNNFIPSFSSCMGWTWSIAVEVQFYIITPFVLRLFYTRRRLGFALLLGLLLISLVVRGVVLYVTNAYDHADPGYYMDAMYIKPYTRVGPYLMGLLLACGWAVQRSKGTSWQPSRATDMTLLLLQLSAWTIMVLLFVLGVGWVPDRSLAEYFMMFWLTRTVWAACVSLLIFCALLAPQIQIRGESLGRAVLFTYPARVLRWFMLWRVWWVSSQLSYPAYLLHPMWITPFYLFLVRDVPVSLWSYLGFCVVNVLVANVGGLILHLAIERPMMNLRYS